MVLSKGTSMLKLGDFSGKCCFVLSRWGSLTSFVTFGKCILRLFVVKSALLGVQVSKFYFNLTLVWNFGLLWSEILDKENRMYKHRCTMFHFHFPTEDRSCLFHYFAFSLYF